MFEQSVTQGPGLGTFTQHTLEILIMLLGAFMLGIWLGWLLWNRYKQEAEKLRLENQSLVATADTLRNELEIQKTRVAAADSEAVNLNASIVSLNRNNAHLRERITALETELETTLARNRQVETELGLSNEPSTVSPADVPLEIADAPADHTPQETIATAESQDVTAPESEPTLNDLAARMEAANLEANDDDSLELVTPPPVAPTFIAPVTTPEPPPVAAAATTKDDLTVIEGIGPKIQMLLNQYGITTYRQLANTEVDRLREILSAAGPQLAMHDPGTWPSQANLAANDEWESLKSIQGFLKGGKRPT